MKFNPSVLRSVLAYLLILGVLLGVIARSLPHTIVGGLPCKEVSTLVCDEVAAECDQEVACSEVPAGAECPMDTSDPGNHDQHHHHHICSGMPLGAVNPFDVDQGLWPPSGLLDITFEQLLAPENPVYELDTPPLI